MTKTINDQLLIDLKNLLIQEVPVTQESICAALAAKGHPVNQSKVSRLLRKINAVKSTNEAGVMTYQLPHDVMPPSINALLSELIIDIKANEVMIIIKTSPGSAPLIARIIDHKRCQILGTIAGDDTIFISPVSVKKIEETENLIRCFLNAERLIDGPTVARLKN
ncbi:MAG: ArgR family transcriptional regulator [Legionella sp.]|nr:ArgR family transcriptional regulator [Legionella sp.]